MKVTLDGTEQIDKLIRDMLRMGDIPDKVRTGMVKAKAKKVQEGQKQTASTMLRGPYYKGAVAASIKIRGTRPTKDGARTSIYFRGEQHGNRLGEIAFINEYGTKKQPARPFIKTAIHKQANAATVAAYKVMLEWMKENDL